MSQSVPLWTPNRLSYESTNYSPLEYEETINIVQLDIIKS